MHIPIHIVLFNEELLDQLVEGAEDAGTGVEFITEDVVRKIFVCKTKDMADVMPPCFGRIQTKEKVLRYWHIGSILRFVVKRMDGNDKISWQ